MKPLKLSFLLILIGSGLLLSGASEPPNPSPEAKADKTDQRNATSGAVVPLARETTPTPSPSKPVQPVPKQQGQNSTAEKGWDWNAILLTAFNGLLVIVTWRLVKVGWKQTELLERAETLTKKSVEVAEIALKADRPYLLVEKIELIGFGNQGRPDPDPRVRGLVAGMIALRNYGQGPARVKEIKCTMKIVDNLLPARDYSGCIEYGGFPDVIGPDKTHDIPVAVLGSVSDADRKSVWEGEKRLIAYGCLRYSDLGEDRNYIGGFYWELHSELRKSLPDSEPFMSRGPKTRNYDGEEHAQPN